MADLAESKLQLQALEKSIEQLNYLMVGLYGGVISFSVQGIAIGNFYQPYYVTSLVSIIILLTGMGFSIALLNAKIMEKHYTWQEIATKEEIDKNPPSGDVTKGYLANLVVGAWKQNADRTTLRAFYYKATRDWYLLIGVAGLFLGKLILPLWK